MLVAPESFPGVILGVIRKVVVEIYISRWAKTKGWRHLFILDTSSFMMKNVCCLYSLELPHLLFIEAILMSTLNVPLFYRRLKMLP